MPFSKAVAGPSDARGDARELVRGRLYALGAMLPLDGRISWVPADARGFQAMNCYLLLEGSGALLVDTGPSGIGKEILRQLERVLPPGTDLTIFHTRNELDCMGNLGAIAETFHVLKVYTGSIWNPFAADERVRTSFSPFGGPRVDAHSGAAVVSVVRTVAGEKIEVGTAGRRLELLRAPVRVLPTMWGYDAATETLFTSDLFGQHLRATAAYDPVAGADDDAEDLSTMGEVTRSRFWWLGYVRDGTDLRSGLEAIFADRQVSRIAPNHGCVIEGRSAVRRHYEAVQRLLGASSAASGWHPNGS